MNKFLAFGGVLYASVGSFLAVAIYLRGSVSAYTSELSWTEALEVGLTWPWEVVKFVALVG